MAQPERDRIIKVLKEKGPLNWQNAFDEVNFNSPNTFTFTMHELINKKQVIESDNLYYLVSEKFELPVFEFEGPLGQFWETKDVPEESLYKATLECLNELIRRKKK